MEPRPADPQPRLPAVRPDGRPPVPVPPPGAPPPAPGPGPRFSWRRFTRSPRGAAGLVIAAAALLLWPFSGLSWIPWLAGIGVMVLLRLLRLDTLLRNWDLHLAGLVVVAGLMLSTGPWDWALAASIGVLLAGLAQLPWWRLAAVGAVMCLASGIGFAVTRIQEEQVQSQQAQQTNEEDFALYGERRPERVLPALLEGISQGDVPAVCGILDERAEQDFVRASGAEDCRGAVEHFRATVRTPPRYDDLDASTVQVGASWLTDGCRTPWAQPPLGGQPLGRIDVRQSPPPGPTYFVAAFLPCETG